jgi:hypothetical protein
MKVKITPRTQAYLDNFDGIFHRAAEQDSSATPSEEETGESEEAENNE